MAFYLLTKGIGTGAMLISAVLWLMGIHTPLTMVVGPVIGLAFVTLTAAILIYDLDRPARFLYILIRPNWRSWMVWGAYFLTAHGAIAGAWVLAGWLKMNGALTALAVPAIVVSILATSYTGFLFAQGLARDLWQGHHAAVDLLAQALAEGAAVLTLAAMAVNQGQSPVVLEVILLGALATHLAFIVYENLLTPGGTRHRAIAVTAIRRGAFAPLFWGIAIVAGGVVPLTMLAAAPSASWILAPAALLALAGTFAWEYVWVEAGQCVPLS